MSRVAVVVALLVLSVGQAASWARPVFACSGGGALDQVAASDVIVGGQVLGWTALPEGAGRGGFVPVRLEMRIDHAWKGSPGPPIVDSTSLMLLPTFDGAGVTTGYRIEWAGSSGACGALDDDPTGMYAVFGLSRLPDGSLRTHLLTRFYIGIEPYGATALPRLQGLGLPATGSGGATGDSMPMVLALFASGAALVALAALMRRSGLRQRAGEHTG